MTTYLLPIAATLVAAGLVYWCCVRPMRRHGDRAESAPPGRAGQPDALDVQLAEARTELARLRTATRDSRARSE